MVSLVKAKRAENMPVLSGRLVNVLFQNFSILVSFLSLHSIETLGSSLHCSPNSNVYPGFFGLFVSLIFSLELVCRFLFSLFRLLDFHLACSGSFFVLLFLRLLVAVCCLLLLILNLLCFFLSIVFLALLLFCRFSATSCISSSFVLE